MRRPGVGTILLVAACLGAAPLALPQDPAPLAAGQDTPQASGRRDSLADTLPRWVAALIGGFGSFAYLVAVHAGLVGKDGDARARILEHFDTVRIQALYVCSGAGVAFVFQLPETRLVPIQAFILGCTWPAVVANYISGRQLGERPPATAETDLKQKAQTVAAVSRDQAQLEANVRTAAEKLEQQRERARQELEKLLAEPENADAGQPHGGDPAGGPP